MTPSRLNGFTTCVALLALCAGCAGRTTERVTARLPLDDARASTGDVVVMVCAVPGAAMFDLDSSSARGAVERVVRRSPAATLVANPAPLDRKADDAATEDSVRAASGDKAAAARLKEARAAASRAADEAALRAARDAGAARACVVEFEHASGELALTLLPIPGWSLNDHFGYTARAYDAASGRLLLETRHAGGHGGLFAIYRPDVRKNLERALAQDLSPVLPPPPKTTRAAQKPFFPIAGIGLFAFEFD